MKDPASRPSYARHRFPPEIIAHAVWLYCRFALSYRDVEELLAERGVVLTDETVRQWCRKFGHSYANALRQRRPQPGDKGHLDEVFVSSNGATSSLWRAVDQDGTVLDILVQARRDKATGHEVPAQTAEGLARCAARGDHGHARQRRRGAARGAPGRRAPPTPGAEQPGRACPPADAGARATDAPLQEPRPRAAVPRRLWPHRQPLPPAPPSPDRRHLPCDTSPTFRHLADQHRHVGDGLSHGPPAPLHAPKHPRTAQPDLT